MLKYKPQFFVDMSTPAIAIGFYKDIPSGFVGGYTIDCVTEMMEEYTKNLYNRLDASDELLREEFQRRRVMVQDLRLLLFSIESAPQDTYTKETIIRIIESIKSILNN